MENLPIDIINRIQCYNIHPVSTLFKTEFKEFIDDHFLEEYNEYNDAYESVDSFTSFSDHFFHGLSSIYPDSRVLNPRNRSFYIYCGYWRECLFLYQHRYGKEFMDDKIKNI
jgi:hypothetical protein